MAMLNRWSRQKKELHQDKLDKPTNMG